MSGESQDVFTNLKKVLLLSVFSCLRIPVSNVCRNTVTSTFDISPETGDFRIRSSTRSHRPPHGREGSTHCNRPPKTYRLLLSVGVWCVGVESPTRSPRLPVAELCQSTTNTPDTGIGNVFDPGDFLSLRSSFSCRWLNKT